MREHATAPLAELVAVYRERTGIGVHPATMAKALAAAGVVREKPVRPSGVTAPVGLRRYGYRDRRRPTESPARYPGSLTDAEWEWVKGLFETEGGRGVPPRVSWRSLLDACCYGVRTGCAWRLLPQEFPAWDTVYKTFRRWSARGRFEAMHDRLGVASKLSIQHYRNVI